VIVRSTDVRVGSGSWLPVLLLLSIGAMLACTGCGSRSDRLGISGQVHLNGAPLDTGSIRFTSLGEKKFATGSVIRGGKYSVPPEKGLPPGAYHVEISSVDESAPPIALRDQAGNVLTHTQPDRIPAEYNINSQQRIEVTPGGENHFVFDIAAKSRG
jgi:hypothetical protein